MHINPDHFLETPEGRITTPERNAIAWSQCYVALEQALRSARPTSKVYVMVGAQGSGKSTWVHRMVLEDSDAIVFDAILVKAEERAPILAAALRYAVPVVAVWLRTPLAVCLERNASRPADEVADEQGLRNVFAALEPPVKAEGFAEVIEVRCRLNQRTVDVPPMNTTSTTAIRQGGQGVSSERHLLTAEVQHHEQPLGAVELRLAAPEDSLCLSVLAMQVFLDTYATQGIRPALAREVLSSYSQARFNEAIADPQARVIVAEHKGHMVGFAHATLATRHELAPNGAQAELLRLYVQEPFTGLKVGTKLLASAENLAAAAGATVLWLTPWVHNHRALAFYARRGYADFGLTYFTFEGESHENRVLAKSLQAAAASAA